MTLNSKECKPGQEQWEEYHSALLSGTRVQYDYRTQEGKLFSTIAKSLDDARKRRDAWLIDPNFNLK